MPCGLSLLRGRSVHRGAECVVGGGAEVPWIRSGRCRTGVGVVKRRYLPEPACALRARHGHRGVGLLCPVILCAPDLLGGKGAVHALRDKPGMVEQAWALWKESNSGCTSEMCGL